MKKILLKWLGIDRILENNIKAKKRIEYLESLVKIGVDYSPAERKSWAVICLNGNPEHVTFVDLNSKDAREILNIFSMFNRNNIWYDYPLGMFE